MSSIGVVLDACVLFPGTLRNFLLRCAGHQLYEFWITDDILEEMRSNLVEKNHVTEEQSQHLVSAIKTAFAGSFVTRHSLIVSSMPINEKDRHVLAAAVSSGSAIIVTQNLKDFPKHLLDSFEVEAMSADEFLVYQYTLEKDMMVNILYEQVSSLKKPPQTIYDQLSRLEINAPKFVSLVKRELSGNRDVDPALILQDVTAKRLKRYK